MMRLLLGLLLAACAREPLQGQAPGASAPGPERDAVLAVVWTPYDFWRDGKLSHCGVDAFDLVKTPEGWRIASGTYTVENNCEPSPLGPLKH